MPKPIQKIEVVVSRDSKGCLAASILQRLRDRNGNQLKLYGKNLLAGKVFKNVDKAIEQVDKLLLKQYKLIDAPEIEYIVEDSAKTYVPISGI